MRNFSSYQKSAEYNLNSNIIKCNRWLVLLEEHVLMIRTHIVFSYISLFGLSKTIRAAVFHACSAAMKSFFFRSIDFISWNVTSNVLHSTNT